MRSLAKLLLLVVTVLSLASCGIPAMRLKPVATLGHGRIEDLVWSPDGSTLAVASSIGLWLYDSAALDSPPRLLSSSHEEEWVRSVAYSPQGNLIATGSHNGLIRLYEMTTDDDNTLTGKEVALWAGHTGWIDNLVFSADGSQLISASSYVYDLSIRLWDVQTSEPQAQIENHMWPIQSIALAPDQTTLAFGTADGSTHLWNIATDSEIRVLKDKEHEAEIHSLTFSPDGATLATGNSEGLVTLWQPDTGTRQATLAEQPRQIDRLAYSPDGSLLASASRDGTIQLWQTADNTPRAVLRSYGETTARGIAFSPDSTRLAAGNGNGSIQIWDTASGEEATVLPGEMAHSVAFNPDGTLLASGSTNTVYLWDVETAAKRATLSGHTGPVRSVAFSPDGSLLASAGADTTVRLWDVATGEQEASLEGHDGPVLSVAFSPDGSLLASASADTTVRLWDVAERSEQAVLTGHEAPVSSVAFNPNGSLLASTGGDGTLRLWDMPQGTEAQVLSGYHTATFSPGGTLVATASGDSMIYLWSVATGERWSTLQGHRGTITSLEFLPVTGAVLASGSSKNHDIFFWSTGEQEKEIETRKLISTMAGHTGAVWSLDFNHDGRMLASASIDGSIRLWQR